MDPAELMDSREGRLTLVDALPASEYEVFNISVPKETARHNAPGSAGKAAIRRDVTDERPEAVVDHNPR